MSTPSHRIVVGVDPGLRMCGVAFVDLQGGELWRAILVRSPEREDDGVEAWLAMAAAVRDAIPKVTGPWVASVELLAVERQAIRAKGKTRMATVGADMLGEPVVTQVTEGAELSTRNPGAILTLAYVTGMVLASVQAKRRLAPYPQTWRKSNAKKAEVVERIAARLTREELTRVESFRNRQIQSNVLDAIGIAKWAAARSSQRSLFELATPALVRPPNAVVD